MLVIKIDQDQNVVEFACPVCMNMTQLSLASYNCDVKGPQDAKSVTITRKDAGEKENPVRIDFTKEPGHTLNCDYAIVDAPAIVNYPEKEKEKGKKKGN